MTDTITPLEALHRLKEACDDSDGCKYGTLSTSFVRNIVRAALAAEPLAKRVSDLVERLGGIEYLEAKQSKQAALAQQAEQVPEQVFKPTDAAVEALKRFEETCTNNEGYDVPKDTMRSLAAIGLVYRTYGDMYCITDFGNHILAKALSQDHREKADSNISRMSQSHK